MSYLVEQRVYTSRNSRSGIAKLALETPAQGTEGDRRVNSLLFVTPRPCPRWYATGRPCSSFALFPLLGFLRTLGRGLDSALFPIWVGESEKGRDPSSTIRVRARHDSSATNERLPRVRCVPFATKKLCHFCFVSNAAPGTPKKTLARSPLKKLQNLASSFLFDAPPRLPSPRGFSKYYTCHLGLAS